MSSKNGGFPPIRYCDNVNEIQKMNNDSQQKKERLFAPKISNNINIRKILKDNVSKPIIDLDNKTEKIDIINEI
jgi:hypothetical protein